jgi:hypothetical protein
MFLHPLLLFLGIFPTFFSFVVDLYIKCDPLLRIVARKRNQFQNMYRRKNLLSFLSFKSFKAVLVLEGHQKFGIIDE